MKVNILLCDTFPGLLPSHIVSYASMFMVMFDTVKENMEYEIFDIRYQRFPPSINKDELYLITSSNTGVYDNIPWVKALISFVRYAHSKRAKFVGVCFGHQLIAEALGGRVERSEKGWGTGIRTSRIVSEKALSYFPKGKMSLHYNHHDQVIELPSEAELFATSDFCPNEGFTIGNHILTFQGHPEYTTGYNRHLLLNHSANEPDDVRRCALSSLKTKTAQGEWAARWIVDMVNTEN